jgi:hypothetical protein
VAGPAKAPLGTGSLVIAVPPGENAQLIETLPADADQDLTAASVESYRYPIANGDTPMTAAAHIIIDAGSNDELYDINSPLATTASWTPLNLYTTTSTWLEYMNGAPTQPQIGSGTYSSFISSNHQGTLKTYEFDFLNCGTTTQSYAIDDVTTGLTTTKTTKTTVDFEPLATTITPKLSATSIVAGGRVTPSLTMKVSGTKLHEVKVTLSKRIAGTSSYRTVATELVNAQGVATGPVQHPTANTAYRWAYSAPAGNPFSSATAAITVHVAPKIAVTVPKHPVAAHRAVSVTGTASPKAKGAVVTLWEAKGKRHVKLAHATEKSSGKFRLTKRLPAGTYHLYVTVAKSTTNSAGTSAKHTVTVR